MAKKALDAYIQESMSGEQASPGPLADAAANFDVGDSAPVSKSWRIRSPLTYVTSDGFLVRLMAGDVISQKQMRGLLDSGVLVVADEL